MNRLYLLAPLFLVACGPHFNPCDRPCPPDVECDCQPYDGSDSPAFVAPAPEPSKPVDPPKPDPKPEAPKGDKPKHEPKGKDDDC